MGGSSVWISVMHMNHVQNNKICKSDSCVRQSLIWCWAFFSDVKTGSECCIFLLLTNFNKAFEANDQKLLSQESESKMKGFKKPESRAGAGRKRTCSSILVYTDGHLRFFRVCAAEGR